MSFGKRGIGVLASARAAAKLSLRGFAKIDARQLDQLVSCAPFVAPIKQTTKVNYAVVIFRDHSEPPHKGTAHHGESLWGVRLKAFISSRPNPAPRPS